MVSQGVKVTVFNPPAITSFPIFLEEIADYYMPGPEHVNYFTIICGASQSFEASDKTWGFF